MRRCLATLPAALVLGACTAAPPGIGQAPVPVAPDLSVTLPRPEELGRSVEVSQLVTARYRGETIAFEGHLSATPDRVLLVGIDGLGRRAITITWTDAAVTAETAPWLPSSLRPENMLADLVLLYWPEAVVRRAIAPSAATLEANSRTRSVSVAGKEITHADYSGADPWSGHVTYRNLAWDYSLDVQSREDTP